MSIRTISTRMAIEGEAKYKQAISACNAELKTLKSSLALVDSSFKGNANSMEALTAKGKALADMQAAQAAKITELENALKNAQDHQKSYADAATEAGKKVSEYQSSLEKLKQSSDDTQKEQAELTAEIEKWKKVQAEAEQANYSAVKGVQSWQQQLNKAKIEQNDLKEAVQQNNQYLEEAAASADGCATSIDEYGKAVEAAAVSTKEAVEGEKAYKQSISNCDSELKTLKSSLALVESQYRGNANSMEALMEKGEVLFDIQAKQAEKVQTLGEALQNAQEHQKKYADAAAEAGQKVAECKDSLEKLKQSTGDTMEEQAALTAEIKKWQQAQTEAEEANADAAQSVQEWQQQLNSAKVEQGDLAEAIQKNNQYLDEAEKSADGCATSIDKYGKETGKAKDAIDQLAAALASAGISKGVQEIAEALMDCAAAAEGFESSMAKVATIADTSVLSLDEIKAQIVGLSNETGKSASAIAEATYAAISAGVDTASAVDTVAQASKLAAGGFTETETAVDVLTTAINAYGLSATEAGKVSDILITTQNKGKTSVDELAKSVGSVIPLAAAYNVEMDNLGTAYAVLTASGTATSEAGTKINAMLSELGDSGSKVAGVLQEQTGKSFAALTKDGASLGDVLDIIGDSVGGNTTAFNELWSSTEAGVGALSIFNKGAENFNSVLGEMQNSAGATEAAYKTMADTTENAHQRMANAAENLKIAIGDQLNPALENLYDTGADAFTWATDFVSSNPGVVGAVAGMTAAIGALSVGVAALSAAPVIIGALNTALTLLAANPIVAVTAAVVGLGVAVKVWATSAMEADESTKAFMESMQNSKTAYEELSATMEGQRQSTAASLEALEELLAAEDKSAAQKQIIAEKVAELNEAVPNLGLAYDAASDSINMTTDALEHLVEKAGEQEEYEAQVARLSELYTEQKQIAAELEAAQAALNEARETGSGNVLTLQNNIDALTEAQEANAEEIAALEEASREYGERQAEAAGKTETMTSRIEALTSEMDTLQAAYQESYDKAMESIDGQLGLFEELDGSAKTSIDSLIDTLKGQVSYMETYSENIKKAMEMGVDEGLVKKLSDGSQESAQILDAIVKGGQDDIKALNEELAKVEEGKANFSDTVAQMETDFNEKMDLLVGDLNDAIQDMDLHDEAYDVGFNNMQGLIDGTAERKKDLVDKYTEMGNAALAAYKRAVAQASPSKKFKEAGSYDIQGIIQGAAGEKDKLAAAYGEVAKAAVDSVEENLPSKVLTTSLEESRAACQKLMTTLSGERYALTASAAALRTLVDVENRSAAQKDAMAKKVAELNKAVPDLGLAYDAATDSINMTTEALEELIGRSEDQKLYEARVERLGELYTEQEQLALELEAAREALSEAEAEGSEGVQVLQESIEALTGAQSANAAQIAELEAATADYGESQAEAAAKAQAMTERITTLTEEVDKLHTSYEDIRKKAADSMESQLGLFNELDGSAQTSIDSLIETLRGQVEYMRVYAENIKLAMELGVDQGLVKKLSDGRQESAQILAAIVQGGQQQIDALNDQFARVELGKGYFAKTVADMEIDFKEKMEELVSDLNDAINEMDLHDEAYTIGMNNVLGLLNGADSQRDELVDQYAQMGKDAIAAYKREVGQASPSKKFQQVGRYDIEGIIQGAESERTRLEAAYTDAAQAALHSMERAMPSTFLEPRNPSPAEQTAAIAAAVRQTADNRPVINLNIDHMEVRSDADIDNVAQKLYYMVERETRGRGGVL